MLILLGLIIYGVYLKRQGFELKKFNQNEKLIFSALVGSYVLFTIFLPIISIVLTGLGMVIQQIRPTIINKLLDK